MIIQEELRHLIEQCLVDAGDVETFRTQREARDKTRDFIERERVKPVEIIDVKGNQRWAIQFNGSKYLRKDGCVS